MTPVMGRAFKDAAGETRQKLGRGEATIQSASQRRGGYVPMKVAERAVALFERLGQLEAIAAGIHEVRLTSGEIDGLRRGARRRNRQRGKSIWTELRMRST